MITEADLAEAWNSGYWHGTSHTGPLNDTAINEKNPHLGGNQDEGHGTHVAEDSVSSVTDHCGHTPAAGDGR